VGASAAELEERIVKYLAEHLLSSTTTVETEVTGTASRIRELLERPRLRRRQERGEMWFLAATPSASADDGVTE
jgi:hypothetical protein